jgi:hypothetical protein
MTLKFINIPYIWSTGLQEWVVSTITSENIGAVRNTVKSEAYSDETHSGTVLGEEVEAIKYSLNGC